MGRTLLLTGRPGIGKTTIIKAVAEALKNSGGFYTQEMRSSGKREGFRLVTLEGQEAIIAHVDLRGQGRPRVSRYGVNVEAIEQVGVKAVRRAMQRERVVIVDEIGKMELLCRPFKEAVLQAVGGPHTVVATAMSGPNLWVDELKALPQVETWEVTEDNREEMAGRVIDWEARDFPGGKHGRRAIETA